MNDNISSLFDGIKILIIENDISVATVLKEMLELQSAQVFIAESGRQALGFCKTHFFHVVFTDLKMPEMSGLETAKHIRKLLPDAFIFLLTGVVQKIHESNLAESGIYQVIHKPFRMREIYQVIQKVIEDTDANSSRT